MAMKHDTDVNALAITQGGLVRDAAVTYCQSDVRRGYSWLGHGGRGVTEVSILHPEYRVGDADWNRSHRSWPLNRFVRSEFELSQLVSAYAGERLLCYGINPRPSPWPREHGHRSAKEHDIETGQSLVLDLDLEGTPSAARLAGVTRFLDTADDYWHSLGIRKPVRAFSGGRGYHLLFAYPPVVTAAVPDLRERHRLFRSRFVAATKPELSKLELRVDAGTLNLRAMVKVYGTGKPGGGLSRFYGRERVEDQSLRDHLLGLYVPQRSVGNGVIVRRVGDTLPSWFAQRLQDDPLLCALWGGRGKTSGDTSNSGYDFSIIARLAAQGYRDPDDLATILHLRPIGLAERERKGRSYVERSVAIALRRVSH